MTDSIPQFEHALISLEGRTAHIELRWPGGIGSWDPAINASLEAVFDWVEDAAPCDVLVLRPRGEATNSTTPPSIDVCRRWEKLVVRLDKLECISVAVIDGPCIRTWMQLALASDLRLATSRSYLQSLELKEGYLPGMNTFRIAKYVGLGIARRLLLTGSRVPANDALGLGLVDEVCISEEIDASIAKLLASIQPVKPVTVRLARRLLNESFATAFEDFMGQYLASQNRCMSDIEREGCGLLEAANADQGS